ncbi:MAG: 2-hydroxychromene-2-carboxylate isomerase, partial [Pacificibacter sp.]
MAQIDYYFSLLSGFAYQAGDRLEKIAAKHGAV